MNTKITATQLGQITLAIIIIFYGLLLWQKEIIRKTEARYAVTTATMLDAGDFLTPHFRSRLRLAKPPLPYWAIMLSSGGGRVSAFSATLPAILASILTACLLYFIGRQVFSALAGAAAATAFLTLPGMIGIGQEVSGDIFVVLFNAVALVCYWQSRSAVYGTEKEVLGLNSLRPKSHAGAWVVGMWLAFGLAFLSKGPPGLCGILPILLTSLVLGEWRYWLRASHLLGLILAVLVGGWWFILMLQMYPEASAVFHAETRRGSGATNHIAPWYYYFKKFPAATLPWGGLVPFALWWARRETDKSKRQFMLYCGIWLVAGFILFSLFKAKRSYYIMPVYLPMGLCVGYLLEVWNRRQVVENAPRKIWRYGISAVGSALLIGGGVVALRLGLASSWTHVLLAGGVATGLFVGYQVWTWREFSVGKKWLPGAVYSLLLPFLALAVLGGQPAIQKRKSVRLFTAGVNQKVPPNAPLYLYLIGTPVYDFYCEQRPLYLDKLPPLYQRVDQVGVAYIILLKKYYLSLVNAAPPSQVYKYEILHRARYPHSKNNHEVLLVRVQARRGGQIREK